MSDSPSSPPAPNYAAAATAQGQANTQAAIAGAQISNPNVNTPYGSQTVSYANDPLTGNPVPTVNQTLSPAQQSLLDSQNSLSQGVLSLGNTYLPQVAAQIGAPIQGNDAQNATNQAYENFTSRLDPQWATNDQVQASTLANEGITVGTPAYEDSMRTYDNSKTDAYQQAQNAAQQFAPQTQQMDITGQSALLNELNAIRSGAQVQTPQFAPLSGQNVAPAPVFNAAQAQAGAAQNTYNAQVGSSNANASGLYGLGGAGLMALALM